MKTKTTIFILLLIAGGFLVFSLVSLDIDSILKGEKLFDLTLPISLLISCLLLLELYNKKTKSREDKE